MPDMTPENSKTRETPIEQWVDRVKIEFKAKQAIGRYSKGEAQGEFPDDEASDILSYMKSIEKTRFNPGETLRENLYVSNVKPAEAFIPGIDPEVQKKIKQIVGPNRSILEVRYREAGEVKWIHMVVPDNTATELSEIILAKTDPNEVQKSIVGLFTKPNPEPNLVDTNFQYTGKRTHRFLINKTDKNDLDRFQELYLSPEKPEADWLKENKPIYQMKGEGWVAEPPHTISGGELTPGKRTNREKINQQESPIKEPPVNLDDTQPHKPISNSGSGEGRGKPPEPPKPPTAETPEKPEKPLNEFEKRLIAAGIDPKDIKDQRLKDFITFFGKVPRLDAKFLNRQYDEWLNTQSKALRGQGKKFDDTEFYPLMGVLSDWIEDLNKLPSQGSSEKRTGDGSEKQKQQRINISEIPNLSEERQREMVRELLEHIENNTLPVSDQINLRQYDQLNTLLDKKALKEPVAKEVRARLRLHSCFSLVERVTGKPEDYIRALRENVVKELQTRGLMLQGDDFEYLYKEMADLKEQSLQIAKAHSIMEELAFSGVPGLKYLDKDNKEKIVRYGGTMTGEHTNETERIIYQRMGGDTLDNRKAVQLAERIAKATFEYSLWKDINSPDPITKAAYFSNVRKSERKKTDGDYGPNFTVELIDGFGLSYFRWATDVSGRHIVHEDIWKEAIKLSVKDGEPARQAINTIYQASMICKSMGEIVSDKKELPQNRDYGNLKLEKDKSIELPQNYNDFMLDPKNKNYSNLATTSYANYLSSYLPNVLIATSNLLKQDFKSQDCTADVIMDWIGAAVKADIKVDSDNNPSNDGYPRELFRLRYYFSMGMVAEVSTQVNLGWDGQLMGQLLNWLRNGVTNKQGVRTALLSPSQEQKITEAINPIWLVTLNSAVESAGRIIRTRPG